MLTVPCFKTPISLFQVDGFRFGGEAAEYCICRFDARASHNVQQGLRVPGSRGVRVAQ